MADPRSAARVRSAVIVDDWVPVVVGVDLPSSCVALYIGTTGTSFTANTTGGTGRTFKNPPAGLILPGRFSQVSAAVGGVADMMAGILL